MPRVARRSWFACITFNIRKPKMNTLEHVNITVSNPKATARMLEQLFGWHIRWEGAAMGGAGYTLHVGTDDSYIAVYSGNDPKQTVPKSDASYATRGAMNHIGVVVDDLDQIEEKVRAMHFTPHSHADYEPGRRFYFHDSDGMEFEVISYTN
jgi:catechol 2,3-dioxygenase-like lactoylglutathione lyase family enzyme